MSVETEPGAAPYQLDRLLFEASRTGSYHIPDHVTSIDLGASIIKEALKVRQFGQTLDEMDGNAVSPVYLDGSGRLYYLPSPVNTFRKDLFEPTINGKSHVFDIRYSGGYEDDAPYLNTFHNLFYSNNSALGLLYLREKDDAQDSLFMRGEQTPIWDKASVKEKVKKWRKDKKSQIKDLTSEYKVSVPFTIWEPVARFDERDRAKRAATLNIFVADFGLRHFTAPKGGRIFTLQSS
jgi:hypothetical protein